MPKVSEDPLHNLVHSLTKAEKRNFEDVFIVDIDSHHMEIECWGDIVSYISSPLSTLSPPSLLNDKTNCSLMFCYANVKLMSMPRSYDKE